MALEIVSEPGYEPVSLAEAREWVRLESDDTANTAVLRLILKAMREDAENLTGRAFISRQYRLSLASWPIDSRWGHRISLPFPPLISVDTLKYYDTDGVLQTLASDQYEVHDEAEPAFILPAYQVRWPSIRSRPDAVQVTFTAGYYAGSPDAEADAQAVIPASLRLWMQTKLATLFKHREQLVTGTIVAKIPRDFTDGLLDSLIVSSRLF